MSELKQFAGFYSIQEAPRLQLPRGGYIAQIINVKVETTSLGKKRLAFLVEIVEGPFAGYFHRDYETRKESPYEAKYRGIYNIAVVDEAGIGVSPGDVERFCRTIGAIEGSNPDYKWNWQIESLLNKYVGLSVRECEFHGNVFTEIGKFIPLSTIRNGNFQPMGRRTVQDSPYAAQTAGQAGAGNHQPYTAASVGQNPYLPSVVYAQPVEATSAGAEKASVVHKAVADDEVPF